MSNLGTTTINPQTPNPYLSTPKTIKKAREEVYAGISFKWFLIITVWAGVSVVLSLPLFFVHNTVIKCFILAAELVWWSIYALHFRTVDLFDETLLKLSFMWDAYCGLHTVSKYTMKIKFLEMIFPLKAIHEGGLIEFTNKKYGILIGYTPPKVQAEDRQIHRLNMQKVIDRLTGDMMLMFIGSSRQSMRTPVLKKITKAMNGKEVPKHIYKYLYSLYKFVNSKGKSTPQWNFYMFLGLGVCENLEAAYSKMTSELPGFLDALENAKIRAEPFTDPKEIAKQYHQFCIPEKLPEGLYF
jgi:hypothetical protein